MRTKRPRHYVAHHWLFMVQPLLRYSRSRDAYVLRVVGRRFGPVLRSDRRLVCQQELEGADRRRMTAT